VVHGEAWVGKTALLEDTIASAAGMRTARVGGERVPTRSRSSDGIALSRITAGQADIGVWARRAPSGVSWGRSNLVCHWLEPQLVDCQNGDHDRLISPSLQWRLECAGVPAGE
jgi:hypothetical protein